MRFLFAAFALVLISLTILTGCSSGPSPAPAATQEQPKPKPPSLYSGLQAFGCVQGLAQKWASDAIPVRLESEINSESNGQGGKATVWRAAFISHSQRLMHYFTCSGSRLKDAPPYGPSAGEETPYSADVPAMAFQPLLLKIDSDKAFDVAQEHGGAALIKKNPDQVVKYFVLWNPKQRVPQWYVMYGQDKESSVGTGIVNALTGAYIGASK
jgi:hypothetical protein